MTTQTLEDILRDLAARGEISHISLTPSQNGKLWRGSFAMCSKFGISYAEDADPATALKMACVTARLKPRVPLKMSEINGAKARENAVIEQAVVDVEPDPYLAGIQAKTDQSADIEDLM